MANPRRTAEAGRKRRPGDGPPPLHGWSSTDEDEIKRRQWRGRTKIAAARKRVLDAIRSAWCVVVTVNESGAVHAFRVVVGDEPLFATIKADRRSRIQETAISAEAMLPGGPYDLWREDERSRRVKDLVGAFAQFPKLPKMLRTREILDTVTDGVEAGIWVARVVRPDRTVRTFWRTAIDALALDDPALELLLPEAATLSGIDADLIGQGTLPGLWESDVITVQDVYDYFAGGHTVALTREGYEEILAIPRCEPARIDAAVLQAVEQGLVWLTSGPASLLSEPVPAGVLSAAAALRPPPARIPVDEMMAESIPEITKAVICNDLKFSVRVEFGGEEPPSAEAVDRINALLADVSDTLRLQ